MSLLDNYNWGTDGEPGLHRAQAVQGSDALCVQSWWKQNNRATLKETRRHTGSAFPS